MLSEYGTNLQRQRLVLEVVNQPDEFLRRQRIGTFVGTIELPLSLENQWAATALAPLYESAAAFSMDDRSGRRRSGSAACALLALRGAGVVAIVIRYIASSQMLR